MMVIGQLTVNVNFKKNLAKIMNGNVAKKKCKEERKHFFFFFFFFFVGNARAQPPFEHSMQGYIPNYLQLLFRTTYFTKHTLNHNNNNTINITYGTEAPRLATVGKR